MKTILLIEEDKNILNALIENAPQGTSMGVGELRQAIKILDLIAEATNQLVLEDRDYEFLILKINSSRFVRADRNLLKLIDKITAA